MSWSSVTIRPGVPRGASRHSQTERIGAGGHGERRGERETSLGVRGVVGAIRSLGAGGQRADHLVERGLVLDDGRDDRAGSAIAGRAGGVRDRTAPSQLQGVIGRRQVQERGEQDRDDQGEPGDRTNSSRTGEPVARSSPGRSTRARRPRGRTDRGGPPTVQPGRDATPSTTCGETLDGVLEILPVRS